MDPTCGPDSWTRIVDLTCGPNSWTRLVDPTHGPDLWTDSWIQLVDPICAPDSWTRLVDQTPGPDSWIPKKQGVVLDWTCGSSMRGRCLTHGSSPRGALKYRIRETPNPSTDVDSSTNILVSACVEKRANSNSVFFLFRAGQGREAGQGRAG